MILEQGAGEEVGQLGQIQDLVADRHADPMPRIVRGRKDAVGQVFYRKIRVGTNVHPGGHVTAAVSSSQ